MGLFGNSDPSSPSSLSWDLKGTPNPSDDLPVRIGFSFENSGLNSTMFGRSCGSMDTSANVPTKPRFIWPEVNIRRSWKVLEINNPRTRDAIEKKTSKCWVDMQEFSVKLKEDYVKELSGRTNLAIKEAAEYCCREFMKDVTRNRPGPGTAWYIMDREDCLKFSCLLWEEEFNSIAPGRPDVCCVDKVEPPEKGKDAVRSCSGDGDGDAAQEAELRFRKDGARSCSRDDDAVREAELRFSESLIKGGRFLPASEMVRLRGYRSTSNPFSQQTWNKQNQTEAVAKEGIFSSTSRLENSGLKSTKFGRSYGSMDTSANVPTKPRFIWPQEGVIPIELKDYAARFRGPRMIPFLLGIASYHKDGPLRWEALQMVYGEAKYGGKWRGALKRAIVLILGPQYDHSLPDEVLKGMAEKKLEEEINKLKDANGGTYPSGTLFFKPAPGGGQCF